MSAPSGHRPAPPSDEFQQFQASQDFHEEDSVTVNDTTDDPGTRNGTSTSTGAGTGTSNGNGTGTARGRFVAVPDAATAPPSAGPTKAAGAPGPAKAPNLPEPAKPAEPAEPAESVRPRSTAGNPPGPNGPGPLLAPEAAARLTDRLERAVGGFVDDPGRAVREADEALEETVRLLTDGLRERRTALQEAWRDGGRGPDGPARTEDLRLSLREYRDLLRQLLAA